MNNIDKNLNKLFSKPKGASIKMQTQWANFNPMQKEQKRKMFPDSDGDGIPNKWDCQPLNPFRQEKFIAYHGTTKDNLKKIRETGKILPFKDIVSLTPNFGVAFSHSTRGPENIPIKKESEPVILAVEIDDKNITRPKDIRDIERRKHLYEIFHKGNIPAENIVKVYEGKEAIEKMARKQVRENNLIYPEVNVPLNTGYLTKEIVEVEPGIFKNLKDIEYKDGMNKNVLISIGTGIDNFKEKIRKSGQTPNEEENRMRFINFKQAGGKTEIPIDIKLEKNNTFSPKIKQKYPDETTIEMMKIDDVLKNQAKEYDLNNPKNIIGNRLQEAKQFIENKNYEKQGFEPTLIGDTGKIMDGRHRLMALKELGYNEVPVEVFPKEQEQQEQVWQPVHKPSSIKNVRVIQKPFTDSFQTYNKDIPKYKKVEFVEPPEYKSDIEYLSPEDAAIEINKGLKNIAEQEMNKLSTKEKAEVLTQDRIELPLTYENLELWKQYPKNYAIKGIDTMDSPLALELQQKAEADLNKELSSPERKEAAIAFMNKNPSYFEGTNRIVALNSLMQNTPLDADFTIAAQQIQEADKEDSSIDTLNESVKFNREEDNYQELTEEEAAEDLFLEELGEK